MSWQWASLTLSVKSDAIGLTDTKPKAAGLLFTNRYSPETQRGAAIRDHAAQVMCDGDRVSVCTHHKRNLTNTEAQKCTGRHTVLASHERDSRARGGRNTWHIHHCRGNLFYRSGMPQVAFMGTPWDGKNMWTGPTTRT